MMETSRLKDLWAIADKADKEWMKDLFNFDLPLEVRKQQRIKAEQTMNAWREELRKV